MIFYRDNYTLKIMILCLNLICSPVLPDNFSAPIWENRPKRADAMFYAFRFPTNIQHFPSLHEKPYCTSIIYNFLHSASARLHCKKVAESRRARACLLILAKVGRRSNNPDRCQCHILLNLPVSGVGTIWNPSILQCAYVSPLKSY